MARKNTHNNAEVEKPALHFLLTEDLLVIAHSGQPFTKEGLRALCRAQMSPAEQTTTTAIESLQDGKACMEEIWKAWIEAYQRNPDRAASHAETERDLSEQLSGQLLKEFMLHAHDMNSGKLFTGEGACLRTILTICDTPRIYSGVLSFRFDRHLGQKVLKQALKKINLSDTPLLRLPFPCARSKEPARVQKLIKEYDTVFILPFRTKTIRQDFLKEWDRTLRAETMLLRLPALDHIIWERDYPIEKTKWIWKRSEGGKAVHTIKDGEHASSLTIKVSELSLRA